MQKPCKALAEEHPEWNEKIHPDFPKYPGRSKFGGAE